MITCDTNVDFVLDYNNSAAGAVFDIDVKNVFYVFYYFSKNHVFNIFYFWNVFYFLVANFFYPTKPANILLNLLNSCIKRLLRNGFYLAAIKILP